MMTLLHDIKHGVQSGADTQHLAEDAYRVLKEARELAGGMSK